MHLPGVTARACRRTCGINGFGQTAAVSENRDRLTISSESPGGDRPASGGATEGDCSGRARRLRPSRSCSGMVRQGSSTRRGWRCWNGPTIFPHPVNNRAPSDRSRCIFSVSSAWTIPGSEPGTLFSPIDNAPILSAPLQENPGSDGKKSLTRQQGRHIPHEQPILRPRSANLLPSAEPVTPCCPVLWNSPCGQVPRLRGSGALIG